MFKFVFTPEVAGTYTIIAKFEGSKSYGSSFAQTAIGVSEPIEQPRPTDTTAQSLGDIYFVPAIAAVTIAIIILCALVAVL